MASAAATAIVVKSKYKNAVFDALLARELAVSFTLAMKPSSTPLSLSTISKLAGRNCEAGTRMTLLS